MFQTVELPLWLLVLILLFAAITALSHFLLPPVRWYFRRRLEKVVAKLNENLDRPIQPFKLARRHDMINRLIYDPQVMQAVADHAKETGVREDVAFHQATIYAREIVPSFSASAYFGVAIKLARFFSQAMYRVRLGHVAETALQDVDQEATMIFVINHRSNIDYFLVTYLAAERSALSYAVGEWARVWPLSRLIKAMGAYFIRRKSRGNLYRKVLARYVRLATDAGVMQAVFPEGGLSLDGALAAPRMGLLKYIVDGFEPDIDGRDVMFVPVALNYDRVLEDRILVAADQAGTRRFKARMSVVFGFFFKQMWLRVTGKYHKFGYAAVSFGAPVSLTAFIEDRRALGLEDVIEPLAEELMQRIGAEVPVLPVPLVATAMLQAEAPLAVADLSRAVIALMARLENAHVHMPRNDVSYMIEVGLRGLIKRKMVRDVGGVVSIAENERPLVEYYAASIAHLFGGPK